MAEAEIKNLKLKFNLVLAGIAIICLISLPYWIAGASAPIHDFLPNVWQMVEYYVFFFIFLAMFAYFMAMALKVRK